MYYGTFLTRMAVERTNKNRCKCYKPEILFEDKDYINEIIIPLSSLYIFYMKLYTEKTTIVLGECLKHTCSCTFYGLYLSGSNFFIPREMNIIFDII